jgi:hypothetical protein
MTVTALRNVQKVQSTTALEFWPNREPDQSIETVPAPTQKGGSSGSA